MKRGGSARQLGRYIFACSLQNLLATDERDPASQVVIDLSDNNSLPGDFSVRIGRVDIRNYYDLLITVFPYQAIISFRVAS